MKKKEESAVLGMKTVQANGEMSTNTKESDFILHQYHRSREHQH